jgi:hypothetical protein
VLAGLLLRLRIGGALSVGAFVLIAAAVYLLELAPPAPLTATTAGLFAAGDLAQQAWRQYVEQLGTPSLTWLIVKLPTWAGMGALLGAAFLVLNERPISAPR